MDEEWLTVTEVSKRLGLDPRQVRRLLDRLEPTDKAKDTQRTHKGAPLTVVRLSAVVSLVGGGVDVGKPTDKANGQRTESKGQGTEKPKDNGQETTDTQGRAVDLSLATNARLQEIADELAAERQARAVAEARLEEISRERDDLRETKDKALQLLDQQQRLSLADRVKIEQLESELREVKKIGSRHEDNAEAPSSPQTGETDQATLWSRFFRRRKG